MSFEREKLENLQQQVEFYLSDDNLKKDKFFHELINSSSEGYLHLDYIKKCNKIKQYDLEDEELIKAIKQSDLLEFNDSLYSLRRKGNKALPFFEGGYKKVKTSTAENKNENIQNLEGGKNGNEEEKLDFNDYEPLIMIFESHETEIECNWSLMQEEFKKAYNYPVYYIRYSKQQKSGHLALNKNKVSKEDLTKIQTEGVTLNNKKFIFKMAEGEDLKIFWDSHGIHYNKIIERSKSGIKQAAKKVDQKSHSIEFANEKYKDANQLKSIFHNILMTTPNNGVIKEPHESMLKELLKHHEKGEKKLEGLDHFTVDIHPEFKETRCFFIVRKDGSREDFSAKKCISNIKENVTGRK